MPRIPLERRSLPCSGLLLLFPPPRPYRGEVSHLGETEVVLTCVPCSEEVTEGPRERLQSQAMGTVICLFSESSDTKGQKHCSRAQRSSTQLLLGCFQ